MPRGNDAEAAARELSSRYRTRGNAEDLIQANRLRRNKLLAKAQLLTVDEEATAELDDKKVKSISGADNVVSYAVRGDYLVFVTEDERGCKSKDAAPLKGKDTESGPELPDDIAANAIKRADV